jgi:hypothetical protein
MPAREQFSDALISMKTPFIDGGIIVIRTSVCSRPVREQLSNVVISLEMLCACGGIINLGVSRTTLCQ